MTQRLSLNLLNNSILKHFSSNSFVRSLTTSRLFLKENDQYARQESYFGFQKVSPEEKSEKVYNVFSNVAEKYDLMNDVMSLGIHRLWKDEFVNYINPLPGTKFLDVAGGTGDIAFRILNKVNEKNDSESHIVVCDINRDMLKVGQKRLQNHEFANSGLISWVEGDAQKLPFEDNSFDVYTIAFGIRNVVHIDQALKEAHRVLRRGGMFACLEFTKVKNPLFESVYNWYSFQIIPALGEIFAGDWKSYQYLVESIKQFPDQQDFGQMIEEAGFTLVQFENLMQGVAAIHKGFKK